MALSGLGSLATVSRVWVRALEFQSSSRWLGVGLLLEEGEGAPWSSLALHFSLPPESQQHSPLRWKAFLGEVEITEILTHAWDESSLGIWTTVTEWLPVGPVSKEGSFGWLSSLSPNEKRDCTSCSKLEQPEGTVPGSGTDTQLLIICPAPLLPSLLAVSLDNAGHSPTRFSQAMLKMGTFSLSGRIR